MRIEIEEEPMIRDFTRARGALPISLVVIHYTAGREAGDLRVLRGGTDRVVSVHYLVGRTEKFGIKAIVPENRVAFHAGKSRWTDHEGVHRSDVNAFSIGIEISNMGPPEEFTDFQYEAVAQLAREIMERHPRITLSRFVGHQDISPGRKIDPGPLWDWKRFRSMVTELKEPPKLVLLSGDLAPVLIDCGARIEDGVTRVNFRALCEALRIVPLPEVNALQDCNPREDPPGVTRIDLRTFLEKRGWDVLSHKLASQNKIYLRRRNPSFDENEDATD